MNQPNLAIKSNLQKWLDLDCVPNSLLFAGSSNSPCEQEALSFASSLIGAPLSESPDLYLFRPEGKLGFHSMESMRSLKDEVYMPPFQAKLKVFVIFAADRMLPPSANALLKTFEEPLLTSVIILTSAHPEKLLPTVRSRCQSVFFQDEVQGSEKLLPLLGPLLKALSIMGAIDLLEEVAKLTALIDNDCAVELKEVKEESAYQKHVREREGEGKEALNYITEAESFFVILMSWYRDIHALHISRPTSSLFLPSLANSIQHRVDQGAFPNLDQVQKSIDRAKEALSRSIPLKNVLESLFFSLKGA